MKTGLRNLRPDHRREMSRCDSQITHRFVPGYPLPDLMQWRQKIVVDADTTVSLRHWLGEAKLPLALGNACFFDALDGPSCSQTSESIS